MSKQTARDLIDEKIVANGAQAITGPVLNNVLNTMVDELADQDDVSQLAQKIDEFAQGKFYGYFSEAGELPAGDIPGFAYVGTEPPFAIYNYDGHTWTDSGLTVNGIPVGNGEDIDFNSDGLLQFANRVYDAGDPDGMGYVILRKDNTFAAQVTAENTIYEIRYDFDLNGGSVTIPTGSLLMFKGGSISNGILSGTFNVKSDNVCFYSIGFSSATIESVSLAWFDIQENVPCTDILNAFFSIKSKEVTIPKYDFPLLVEVPGSADSDGLYSCIKLAQSDSIIDFSDNTVSLVANASDRYCILSVTGSNTIIKNAKIIGDVSSHTGATGEWGQGISITKGHDIIIENCEVNECWGDGIDLVDVSVSGVDYYPYNITIKNTKCLKNRRQGLSIEAGRNIQVIGCEFAYTGQIKATAPTSGVDIEPWHDETRAQVNEVIFDSCEIHDNSGAKEFMISGGGSYVNATISNIILRNCIIFNTAGTVKPLIDSTYATAVVIENSIIGTTVYNGLTRISNAGSLTLIGSKINGQLYITGCDTSVKIGRVDLFRNNNTTASGYASVKKAFEIWSCSNVNVYDSKFNTVVNGCFYIHETGINFEGCEFSDINTSTSTDDRLVVNASFVSMKSCKLSLGSSLTFIATSSQTHHFSIYDSTWEKKAIGPDFFFFVNLNSRNSDYSYDIEIKDTQLICPKGGIFTRGAASDSVKIYIERFPEIAIVPNYNDYRLLPTNDNNNDYPIKHSGTTTMRGYVANHLNTYQVGFFFFDTTLSKPCWWDGTGWKDATGTTV